MENWNCYFDLRMLEHGGLAKPVAKRMAIGTRVLTRKGWKGHDDACQKIHLEGIW